MLQKLTKRQTEVQNYNEFINTLSRTIKGIQNVSNLIKSSFIFSSTKSPSLFLS